MAELADARDLGLVGKNRGGLEDGSMLLPIDATAYEQRRATIAQQRNLIARLRKFAAWQREQQQEPQ